MPTGPRARSHLVAGFCTSLIWAPARLLAQQFIEDSTNRFPQPDPLDYSNQVTIGDLDADADLDLVWANGGNFNTAGPPQVARIFINNGAGVFTDETALRHPLAVLAEPMDAIFGDIDADFDLDVRTASTANNVSRMYRNNGSGVFSTVTPFPPDNNAYSYDFGDIDNDGDLDLFGANANPATANADLLLCNDGGGTFTNISGNLSPNPAVDDNDSRFFDYDNDGDRDLIVARLGGTAERIYNNNGAGVFTEVAGLITPISDSSLDVKVADLNADSRLDIVTAQGESGSFRNRIYMNVTGPVNTRPPVVVATEQHADTTSVAGPYVVRAAVLDDMSSDRNFLDRGVALRFSVSGGPTQQVPMRYSGGQVYRGVIPGAPCGGTVRYFVIATDFANNTATGPARTFTVTSTVLPGDFDADGDRDAADRDILVAVLLGLDTDPAHVCCADMNGDGRRDGLDIQPWVDLIP